MFQRAADGAAAMIGGIRADQWQASTPCTEWNVEQLVTHMAARPGYLMNALGLDGSPVALDEMSYRKAVDRCVEALRVPGALDARCMSPAGFEWGVGEAVAGT